MHARQKRREKRPFFTTAREPTKATAISYRPVMVLSISAFRGLYFPEEEEEEIGWHDSSTIFTAKTTAEMMHPDTQEKK